MDCEVADDGTDCDYSVQQDYGSISNYSTLGKTTQWIARLRTMERTATTACNKTTAASATTARSGRRHNGLRGCGRWNGLRLQRATRLRQHQQLQHAQNGDKGGVRLRNSVQVTIAGQRGGVGEGDRSGSSRSTTTQLCPSHHCRSARSSWRRRLE